MQFLLEIGANLEAKDEDGGIPLHDACAGGDFLSTFWFLISILLFKIFLHFF